MSVGTAWSPILKGEVLCTSIGVLRLRLLEHFRDSDVLRDLARTIRDERGELSTCVGEGENPFGYFVSHLLEVLKEAGLIKNGEEDRYFLAKDAHFGLNDLLALAQAQTEPPRYPKPVKIFGNGDLLFANRKFVGKTPTHDDIVNIHYLQEYAEWYKGSPEGLILPDPWQRAEYASCRLLDLMVKIAGGLTPGLLEAEVILRCQMEFVNSRALWWAWALFAYVRGNALILNAISDLAKGKDVAVRVYFEEDQRQLRILLEVARLSKEFPALGKYLDFDWLNTPFSF